MDRLFFLTLNMICYRLIISDKCKNVRLLKKLLQVYLSVTDDTIIKIIIKY